MTDSKTKHLEKIIQAMNRKPTLAQQFIGHFSKIVEVWEIQHDDLGQLLRKIRKEQKISLRAHAKLMGFSTPFVGDLELGRRNWTKENVQLYLSKLPVQPEAPQRLYRIRGKA